MPAAIRSEISRHLVQIADFYKPFHSSPTILDSYHSSPLLLSPASIDGYNSTGSGSMASYAASSSQSPQRRHVASQTNDPLNDPFVMACDYVKYRLSQGEIEWEECPDLPDSTMARLVMRTVAQEFEQRYNADLNELVDKLTIQSETIYPEFLQVVEQLFKDDDNDEQVFKITWGRIVALFAYVGALAARCMVNDHADLVMQVAQFFGVFLSDRIDFWVQQQGGWEAFINWHGGADQSERRTVSYLAAGLLGGSIVGAVTLSRAL